MSGLTLVTDLHPDRKCITLRRISIGRKVRFLRRISSRAAFIWFVVLVVVAIAQATWWITFMAILVDEKVEIAEQLGAASQLVETIRQQEIHRQIMVGLEGTFFLVLILVGAWLIYQSLRASEKLKFHQQNFLLAVTHELKTPLASMKLSLDSLQSPKISPEKKAAVIPRAQEDIRRLEKIIDNVLQAGRFERSSQPLAIGPTDLSRLVNQAVDDIAKIRTDQSTTIDRDIEQSVRISADAPALARAVEAVLENCLKYHDNRAIEVRVSMRRRGKHAEITIADQGSGLSTEDVSAVFDRFYRVGNEMTRRTPGTGLGLYLAREIIKAHHGKIVAESGGLGKGTTFSITLPVGDAV